MRVLFCHDGPISKNQNGEFFTVSYTDEVVARYYEFGDDLKFLIRVENLDSHDDLSGLSKMTLSSENVVQVPDFKTIKGMILLKRKASSIIKEAVSQADFIIVRLPSSIGRIAAEDALKQGKPYLVEVVGHPFDILWYHSWKGKLLSFYESSKNKYVIRKAPFAIYVTSQYLQKEYPCEGLSVGIADTSIKLSDEQVLINRINKIKTNKSGKLVLGTIGSASVKYKGQEYVIKALSLLKNKGISNFEYQMVGGGNPSRLKKIAERYGVLDQVVFKGNVQHHEIFNWLDRDIDLYIQPSMTEGLPRSVVEAMSRALPCIVSNCGGNPELIADNCVYNKSYNQVCQISELLESYNQTKQINQAKRNFHEALKYSTSNLDKERNLFYNMIKLHLNS